MDFFPIISIINLILFVQFLIVNGVGPDYTVNSHSFGCDVTTAHELFVQKYNDISLPLNNMRMLIKKGGKPYLHVNMQQVTRSLANQHLPIWILSGVVDINSVNYPYGDDLERDYNVMNELGEFTTYQELKTSSATVYFHKSRKLDGVINHRFVIRNLCIDIFDANHVSLRLSYGSGIFLQSLEYGHEFMDGEFPDTNSGVNSQNNLNTYNNRVYDGYPEVLVLVSWDMARSWIKGVKKSDWYTTIVSHVLVLFNGVDMLYAKLEKTKIQINLAGIIIGMERESFGFLEKCKTDANRKEYLKYGFDGRCVTSGLRHYLIARRHKIPIQSYDLVMFLTRAGLYYMKKEPFRNDVMKLNRCVVDGISDCMDELYECRKYNYDIILAGSVTNNGYIGNYPTIAHEIAHLMTVKHDSPPFFTYDGKCCGYILKPSGDWCKRCLSWSKMSELTFKLFFSSPNCCLFVNKPRSLHPPGRRLTLSANEQCQCYGYKSAKKFRDVLKSFCGKRLQCLADDNEFYSTIIPIDGTQCQNNKVCWEGSCEKIEIFQPLILDKYSSTIV